MSALERWATRCGAHQGSKDFCLAMAFVLSIEGGKAAERAKREVGESAFAEMLQLEIERFVVKADSCGEIDMAAGLRLALTWLREEMEQEEPQPVPSPHPATG